jgi:hypothetical protein
MTEYNENNEAVPTPSYEERIEEEAKRLEAEAEKTAVFNELRDLDWEYRYLGSDNVDIAFARATVKILKSKIDGRKATITAVEEWVRDQTEFDDQTKELLEILEEHLGLDITTSEVIDVTIGAKVYFSRKVWEDADDLADEVVSNLNVTLSTGWSGTDVDDYSIESIEKEW